jgi:maltose O-acetyltransferase
MYTRPLFKKVGKRVNLQSRLRIDGWQNISIGDNSGLGRNCSISAIAPVTIGNNVMIAEDLIIKTSNHSISRIENMMDLPVNSKSISIGNNVWIGARVIILSGVTIGDNVVIAAGAVVSKSFGSNCVIGGVPARIIKEIE